MNARGLKAVSVYIGSIIIFILWVLGIALLPDPWWTVAYMTPFAVALFVGAIALGIYIYNEFSEEYSDE